MSRGGAAAIAAAVLAAGLHWGTFAVGGSDSYCYVHQAQGWASGRLQPVEALALDAPWPDAALTFTPTGHVPSPTVPGAVVPMCPAGLSIVMAPFLAAAPAPAGLAFLVVPLFGALLAVASYRVGSRFSPRVGLAAAALVACSPAFLFQLMQPMSDVPAAALWVLAVACATGSRRYAPVTAGLATSAAILVRPNLLPLGIVLGVFFLTRPTRAWAERVRDAASFAAASAPGCLAIGAIQQMFYGSPMRSGYGVLSGLFSVSHVAPNAIRYLRWMWESHTPAWLLACAAPWLLGGWLQGLLLALAVVNVACYLPYVVFDDWWYLRFLLPGIAFLLILTAASLDAAVARVMQKVSRNAPDGLRRSLAGSVSGRPALVRTLLVGFAAVAICAALIQEARARSVFDLQRLESRYVRAGQYVARRLPANALVITAWESGSIRFYSNRKTLAWDALDPAWLERALAASRARGFEPYLLFERWEEPLFRQRFVGTQTGALDWPPQVEIAGQVRIYRPGDRERYLSGARLSTEYSR